jgi:hypothetical protein
MASYCEHIDKSLGLHQLVFVHIELHVLNLKYALAITLLSTHHIYAHLDHHKSVVEKEFRVFDDGKGFVIGGLIIRICCIGASNRKPQTPARQTFR